MHVRVCLCVCVRACYFSYLVSNLILTVSNYFDTTVLEPVETSLYLICLFTQITK